MLLSQIPEIEYKANCAIDELIELGKAYHQRGWCLGTSGNFSVVLNKDPLILLVTASGKDKSRLTQADFVLLDESGNALKDNSPKPSAETLLHITAVKQSKASAVLHTHSVWSTVLSQKHFESGYLEIEGYEMLKGLGDIKTHNTRVKIPILDNCQNMNKFQELVTNKFDQDADNMKYAYLIRKHGMHCWGKDLEEAKRHVEIMEFLLEATGRLEGGQLVAIVSIADESKQIYDPKEISTFLEPFGIWYECWDTEGRIQDNSSHDEILLAYETEINKLKKRGGFITADVIDVNPDTKGLDAMLDKFKVEHTHDEDEVRFVVAGSGIFHINPVSKPVFSVEMQPGDLINVPKGTRHWFNLCKEKTIKTIRLFQEQTGWTPHYIENSAHSKYEPVCFGMSFLPDRTTIGD